MEGEVEIVRSGEPIGTLAFQSAVLECAPLSPAEAASHDQAPEREGVKVVATTMLMSEAARTRLTDAFGPHMVLLPDAP